MKILNGTLAVLFFLFAVLQYNDPDPLPWVLVYVSAATLCTLAAFGGYFKWVTVGVTVALTVWLLALLPGVLGWIGDGMPSIAGAMKAETPYIEETREFGGLLMAVLAMVPLWRQAVLKQRRGVEAQD